MQAWCRRAYEELPKRLSRLKERAAKGIHHVVNRHRSAPCMAGRLLLGAFNTVGATPLCLGLAPHLQGKTGAQHRRHRWFCTARGQGARVQRFLRDCFFFVLHSMQVTGCKRGGQTGAGRGESRAVARTGHCALPPAACAAIAGCRRGACGHKRHRPNAQAKRSIKATTRQRGNR